MPRMAQQHHLKRRLGLREKLDPSFGFPHYADRYVNVAYGDDPAITARIRIYPKREGHFHRVCVFCPSCGSEMSLGRLNQHYLTKACWNSTCTNANSPTRMEEMIRR